MSRTGYVLTGGKSSRMGRDKALLPVPEGVLVQRVAARVAAAAGSATLVGDPARYGGFGFLAIPDIFPGNGPLAGIHAALQHTQSDWNLIVACDLPEVPTELLQQLLKAAAESHGASAVIPRTPDGRFSPVCAAYHRSVLAVAGNALGAGRRKLLDLVDSLTVIYYPVDRVAYLQNVNTPEDWAEYAAD